MSLRISPGKRFSTRAIEAGEHDRRRHEPAGVCASRGQPFPRGREEADRGVALSNWAMGNPVALHPRGDRSHDESEGVQRTDVTERRIRVYRNTTRITQFAPIVGRTGIL